MRKLISILLALIIILGIYSYVINRRVALSKERQEKERIAQIAVEKLEQERVRLSEARELQEQNEKKEQEEQLKKLSRDTDEKKIEDLKKIIRSTLKDPDSSQFRELFLNFSKTALCGEVNAKNSYGGYVGFRSFVATSEGAISWNGQNCISSSTNSRIACHEEQLAYIKAAVGNGCKSQAEINSQLLH
jgi:ABC-type multidrug transport system fused ATPase/permease subunit